MMRRAFHLENGRNENCQPQLYPGSSVFGEALKQVRSTLQFRGLLHPSCFNAYSASGLFAPIEILFWNDGESLRRHGFASKRRSHDRRCSGTCGASPSVNMCG